MLGNSVGLIGRITKDIEIKTTPTGKSVVNFTIARDPLKTASGDGVTLFMDCVAWGKTAELISQYCSKGKKIGVEGTLVQRIWKTKEGVDRRVTEVVVQSIEFIESTGTVTKTDKKDPSPSITDVADTDVPW